VLTFKGPEKVSRTHHAPKPLSSRYQLLTTPAVLSSPLLSLPTELLIQIFYYADALDQLCLALQTPPPNLRISFSEDTLSHRTERFLPQDGAAKASHAIGQSWTTKEELGFLC
jgi:hypothetical protein